MKQWEKRDPLLRFTKYLEMEGLLDPQKQGALEAEVRHEIKLAVERFEALPAPAPLEMFDYVYAQRPPELEAQRQELAAALEETAASQPPLKRAAGR